MPPASSAKTSVLLVCGEDDFGVKERARRVVIEAGDHGVGKLDGRVEKFHLAAGKPAVDAGMHSEGVIIERARDAIRQGDAIWIGDDMVERSISIPRLSEQA